jgi:molybdate transport system substrate-binding protein
MRLLACLLLMTALLAASCSGDDDAEGTDTGTGAGEAGGLAVLADPSLEPIFRELAPEASFTFASPDELAALIRENERADVYATAGTSYGDELYADGFLQQQQIFARNRVVVVVPADNPAGVESLDDLAGEGVELALGAEGIPIGDAARNALTELGRDDVLENASSEESDADGVVAKVVAGEADAGLVYYTDALAAGDEVQVVELPAQPLVEYPIAVVTSSDEFDAAEAFVQLVLGEEGRQALEEAGFEP